ncbi:MAG: peptide chain release factor 2 [Candidatus Nealsonbacteria bacterium CG09_land_8_20_14_0_10_42_14]|uniref:Peptide chain release factor 2 n=1 Tax=Candidatus Nealsonbacteria bacterium CG09_land_8_20_14_0_10_42_14 TaxID=1974707 RepID=A0A2H0WXB4_9BACT|nr:MAG: peptide chain release factor 2 [Candidatus Nealsonbacteria bacterium CG09_land_8_20_14_0_10_42_14]
MIRKKQPIYKVNSASWRTVFDVAAKREKAKELEKEIQRPDFWQDKEKAVKVTQELSGLHQEVADFEKLESETDLKVLAEKIAEKELQIFLAGKYDKGSAILSVYAGAGGQDAQDWATMLLRMYLKYCDQKSFKTKILEQSFGEPGPEGRIGTKSVTLEVRGAYAYGFLRKESGVHRLVRISPFSSKNLRHTSFAMVEVLPEISAAEEAEIKIKPEELKVETFRASGPGGQYVNRRESAVRITHLPTKIVVSCQLERLQGQNKAQAMKVLIAKLHLLKEKEKEKEMAKIKGKQVSIEWGSQIRSYVLHPYKMVKDLRTGVETSNIESVLDGKLDEFVEAEIRHK